MKKKVGIFVAWPYANGYLHLGHIAGAYLPADIFARSQRMRGNSVMMVSGSDAHGTPITLKAREEGVEPIEIVSRYHESFLKDFQALGISFDLFTHTHTDNHFATTKELFNSIHARGGFVERDVKQFYDESVKMFLPDRYVNGTCPRCDSTDARGDQCEKCGATFSSIELRDPISRISGKTPILKTTKHLFFQMQEYENELRDFVELRPHWRAAVLQFTKGLLDAGLQPRAMTRDMEWGVPVPLEGWKGKVLYVWFDAVIGYLSASKEYADFCGKNWKEWWSEPSKSFYFIGKDNVPFHSIVWPAELIASGMGLSLPWDVSANQFLNMEGKKFSTSRGMAIWLSDALQDYPVDSLRYYLTAIAPETRDTNFSRDEMLQRNNGELVAAWGNLVNRMLGFIWNKFNARIPQPIGLGGQDLEMLNEIDACLKKTGMHYDNVEIRDALSEAMSGSRKVNKFLDISAPWKKIQNDRQAAANSVFAALAAIEKLAKAFSPILPQSSQKVLDFLGWKERIFGTQHISGQKSNARLRYKPLDENDASECIWDKSYIESGTPVMEPSPIFQILE